MTQSDQAQRAARAHLQAEHRAILQATLHAKRSDKIPARRNTSGAEAITALVVVVTVIGLLVLVMKYAN